MARYIHQLIDWPNFYWNQSKLAPLLAKTHQHHGRVLGLMHALGFSFQHETSLNMLTLDVIKSSEIEGEILNPDQVRSSIARHLGLSIEKYTKASRNAQGAVDVIMDATQLFDEPLAQDRLCHWHILLMSGDIHNAYLRAGSWRNDVEGPMQVVSGAIGQEKVHFEAPSADRLDREMKVFIDWANRHDETDPLIKAAIAHLWFVTIHPFDDGNGRIARAITDWFLARSEESAQRFYSMSAQIRDERKSYYAVLEATQKGTLDITRYLEWFLECLDHAFDKTEKTVQAVLYKNKFWEQHANTPFNARQKIMVNKLFDSFFGKLTTTKWAKMTKCSQDTALRDIQELIQWNVLRKDEAGGRSTSYSLNVTPP